MRRKVGDDEYRRVIVLGPEAIRALVQFAVVSVTLPLLIYWLITGHLTVDWNDDEGILAGLLGLAGLVAWGVIIYRA